MTGPAASVAKSAETPLASVRRVAPGIALAVGVALLSYAAEPLIAEAIRAASGWSYRLPDIVIALLLGIALNGIAAQKTFEPGLAWCVKKLLRIAIALLGVRIALGDIVHLGVSVAALVIIGMALTIAAGFWLARFFQLDVGYGALAGAATAVCGASAALATATVVPNYTQKGAD